MSQSYGLRFLPAEHIMKSNISGFPEFLPNEQIAFNNIMNTIKEHFELYGFIPMDTPAVERIETLLAKGNDSEIYGLYRLADENSKKKLGLRFDLTVPFARYILSHQGDMIFPHKRYQIGPVWRGERPQFGRYRQFYQCDVDIISEDELSISHDAEILKLITETLCDLNIPTFTTKINNRKILTGFLNQIIIGERAEERVSGCVRLIDKIDKISTDEFWKSIEEFGIFSKDLTKLKSFLEIEKRGSNEEILKILHSLKFNTEFNKGVSELETVIDLLKKFGIEDRYIKISTSLARGLSYYTGTVFETSFDDIKDVGSICGGGRYDDLISIISGNDKKFVGVGASIGISRMVPKLLDRGLLNCTKATTTQLLVTVQNRTFIGSYMNLSEKFRRLGIKTETYLQDKSLGAQIGYASRKGIKYVLIANDVELLDNKAIIRNLETKKQTIIRTEYMGKEVVDLLK